MPGGDGTGPWGQGAGTGWGRGGCVPFGRGARGGRGMGGWFGRTFGAMRNAFAPFNAGDELSELKAEQEAIGRRISELEKEKK